MMTYEDYRLEEPGLTGLIEMLAEKNADAKVTMIEGTRTVVATISMKHFGGKGEHKDDMVTLTAFATDTKDDAPHVSVYVPGRQLCEHLKPMTPAKAMSTIFNYIHTLDE